MAMVHAQEQQRQQEMQKKKSEQADKRPPLTRGRQPGPRLDPCRVSKMAVADVGWSMTPRSIRLPPLASRRAHVRSLFSLLLGDGDLSATSTGPRDATERERDRRAGTPSESLSPA